MEDYNRQTIKNYHRLDNYVKWRIEFNIMPDRTDVTKFFDQGEIQTDQV